MQENKKEIRKRILALRDLLPESEVVSRSRKITEKIIGLQVFKDSKTVMCYVNFRKEVGTMDFLHRCLSEGKKLALPIVMNSTDIGAYEIDCLDSGMELSSFGILEPRKDSCRVVLPEEIDFIVVPGVAFDTVKNRVGFGAGYYDRFLNMTRDDCFKTGIAFDLQIVDIIPADVHDIPMDCVITEERFI